LADTLSLIGNLTILGEVCYRLTYVGRVRRVELPLVVLKALAMRGNTRLNALVRIVDLVEDIFRWMAFRLLPHFVIDRVAQDVVTDAQVFRFVAFVVVDNWLRCAHRIHRILSIFLGRGVRHAERLLFSMLRLLHWVEPVWGTELPWVTLLTSTRRVLTSGVRVGFGFNFYEMGSLD
jgi:hypothetical protein